MQSSSGHWHMEMEKPFLFRSRRARPGSAVNAERRAGCQEACPQEGDECHYGRASGGACFAGGSTVGLKDCCSSKRGSFTPFVAPALEVSNGAGRAPAQGWRRLQRSLLRRQLQCWAPSKNSSKNPWGQEEGGGSVDEPHRAWQAQTQ